MLRIKKTKFFVSFGLFLFLFLIVEFIILFNLKPIENGHDFESHSFIRRNPKIENIRNFLTDLKIRIKSSQFLNPNNQFLQVDLLYQLPFYHLKNLNLNKTLIEYEAAKNNNLIVTIKGINPSKSVFYQPDENGLFKCINSNQKIKYELINDDFCDCIDGTDEPGTNACHFGTFYCKTQHELLVNNYIPSSRLNDGICDCCDGSDESEELKCKNSCDLKMNQQKSDNELFRQALALKKTYLIDGNGKDEGLYGPEGIFYALSNRCFNIDWSEFSFQVCPYKKVTQFKLNQNTNGISIGHNSVLENRNNKFKLKMSNGERTNCPNSRESEINFVCGLEEELVKMNEFYKCFYVFDLKTPSAC